MRDLYCSTDITLESLLNTQVCRNFTYIKEFCEAYSSLVPTDGKTIVDEAFKTRL